MASPGIPNFRNVGIQLKVLCKVWHKRSQHCLTSASANMTSLQSTVKAALQPGLDGLVACATLAKQLLRDQSLIYDICALPHGGVAALVRMLNAPGDGVNIPEAVCSAICEFTVTPPSHRVSAARDSLVSAGAVAGILQHLQRRSQR